MKPRATETLAVLFTNFVVNVMNILCVCVFFALIRAALALLGRVRLCASFARCLAN